MTGINPNLKNELRRIFNKHDPVGIFMHEDVNFNEYDPEISGIVIRFKRSKNLKEFADEINNVFHNMFSGIRIRKDTLDKLAKDVYELLNSELK
ncbi:MAG: hypothetical protein AABX33_03400 [Nanoarchaeota archaeon]